MLRPFLALTLAGLGAIASTHGQGAPAARLLRISAVVVDADERPVTNLKKEDLEVWIGGYRVPIEGLTMATDAGDERSGRLTVLLLDDMTLEPALTSRVREIARRFVTRMAPGDRMAVVTLNGQGMESTDDRTRLLRSIDTYNLLPTTVQRLDLLGEHVLKTIASLSRQLVEQPGAEDDRRDRRGVALRHAHPSADAGPRAARRMDRRDARHGVGRRALLRHRPVRGRRVAER